MFHVSPDSPTLAPNLISRIRHGLHKYLKQELDRAGLPGLVPSHGLILGCLYNEDHMPMIVLRNLSDAEKARLPFLQTNWKIAVIFNAKPRQRTAE